MAEPKKETVQISLSPGPEQAGPALSVAKREATRILLPTRVAGGPILRVPPKITPSPSAEATTTIPSATPLSLLPDTGIQPAPAVITSRPVSSVEGIPRPVCWALLGISTLIFLIQIWNYVVS
jgi:hypothetical protein